MTYKKFCNNFYNSDLKNLISHAQNNYIFIEKKWETEGAWNHWTLEINDEDDGIYYISDLIQNEKAYDNAEKLLKDLFKAYI